ncbi:MAG TPA: sugar ABC transporter permease [Bacilli bacterium]|nr:sugar ABC transporter permease [Bacilli bacterium]
MSNKKTKDVEVKKDQVQPVNHLQDDVAFLERGPMQVRRNIAVPNWVKVLLALTPALIFLLLFTIYPIFNTTMISFIENFAWQDGMGSFAISNYRQQLSFFENFDEWKAYYEAVDPDKIFTRPLKPIFSFDNFRRVIADTAFHNALLNTAILTIISVPLTIIISLLLAVSLNSIKPLRGMYQTIFFLPYVTNTIALGMVFNTLFSHQTGGLMNQVMQFFGAKPVAWIRFGLPESDTFVPASKLSLGIAIVVESIWAGIAFKILVFMAGLASIDKQYYDAARIDGTKRGRIFRKITVPLLSPQILYITITSFIGSFKAYQNIIALVGKSAIDFGGTDGRLWLTVVGYVYRYRIHSNTLPLAAAGSIVLLGVILLITLVQMQVSKRRVHY